MDTRGTLYLCATPIGNLGDITERVLTTLAEVDLIAAEDTRNSMGLLNHFEIHTPMTSYHEFNKYDKAEYLVDELRAGKNIALITDAGTPAISDPGEILVDLCHKEGIPVTSLPGACACITALTLSGLPSRRFCFEGFLPQEKKELNARLKILATETRTAILYEAPHRLRKTLEDLRKGLGEEGKDRPLALCRELTKKFESVERTTVEGALVLYSEKEPRGEYVLVLGGIPEEVLKEQEEKEWSSLALEEHMALYEAKGIDRKEAMKLVAKDRGISKRDVYQALLSKE